MRFRRSLSVVGAVALSGASIVGASLVVAGVTAVPAGAATITVDDATDGPANAADCTDVTPGNCSVRDTLAAATSGGGDTVVLQAGINYGLDCPGQGNLDHTSATPLTIQGNGATITQGGQVACGGADFFDVFDDAGPLTLITDTTFTGGTQGGISGLDIRLTRSRLTGNTGNFVLFGANNVELHQSTVADNPNYSGVDSRGTALIVDSTISGHSTSGQGAGIDAAGHLTIVNSTIANNADTSNASTGGGIYAENGLDLVHSTVTGNAAVGPSPAQIAIADGVFRSFGSVVASPGAGTTNSAFLTQTASASSQGYNFSDDASCAFTGTGDRQSAGDPVLGALGANGGPTLTRLPGAGSPLIDAIPVAASGGGDAIAGFTVTTDQRGITRPQVAGCEIGAVEVAAVAVTASPRFTG